MRHALLLMVAVGLSSMAAWAADDCVKCHQGVTPYIVLDWQNSGHHGAEVGDPYLRARVSSALA